MLWRSADPRTGQVVEYPMVVSQQLEAAFQAGKDKVCIAVLPKGVVLWVPFGLPHHTHNHTHVARIRGRTHERSLPAFAHTGTQSVRS